MALTIELTQEEKDIVSSQAKEVKPTWYNSAVGNSVPITEDFEAFLILEQFGFKDKMTDNIKSVTAETADSLEEDLFKESLEVEQQLVNEILAECTAKLGDSDKAKEPLRESKFVNVFEIGQMFSDIGSSQGPLSTVNRLNLFRRNYLTKLNLRFKPNVASAEQKKQTTSWLQVLAQY